MVLPPRNGISLCAGGGGLDMGLMLSEPEFHTRAFVEWDEYPRRSIIAAQRAGYFAPAPIWDDLTTFDAKPINGAIDTLLAGYPCQPFSHAGQRRGTEDERHLWPEVARVIAELGSGLEWVFLENVSGHVSLGAETVLRELRGMGFTPAAGLFSAAETGAPHERLRWFCVAHKPRRGCGILRDAAFTRRSGYTDGGVGALAYTYGRHSGAERQQRSGQQRFQPQGGYAGAVLDELANASCGRFSGSEPGQDQQPGRAEAVGSGEPLGDPARPRCPQARGGTDKHEKRKGWQQVLGDGQRELADPSGARPQGREQPGSPDKRNRTPAYESASERGSAWLFPPGPSEAAAWGAVMAASPDRAPSFARRDAALDFAALLSPDKAESLERDTRGMAGLEQLLAVAEQTGALVDQAQAFTRIRGMAHGLAHRSRALRLLGNGVFPLAAAHAWRTLSAAHGLGRVDLGAAIDSPEDDAGRPVWRSE